MTTITISDEVTTSTGRPPLRFSMEVPAMQITVRELIRARVTGEVNDYNLQLPEYFEGLVQPSGTEATLNGFRTRGRVIDPARQVEQAERAFLSNGFLLLVDNRQVDALDEVIMIDDATMVTFLKLVPLVGG